MMPNTPNRVISMAALLVTGLVVELRAAPWELVPRLSLSEQYNDNVFFSDADEVDDFITSIGIGLGVSYRQPRLSGALSIGSGAQIFANETSESDAFSNQSGSLLLQYLATPRLSLSLTDSIARVDNTRTGPRIRPDNTIPPEQQPFPDVPEPGPAIDAGSLLPRGEVFSNFASVGADYQLAPKWSTAVSYRNTVNDFSAPDGRDQTNGVNASLNYSFRPGMSLSGSYGYTRFDLSEAADTASHSATVGAGYALDEVWSIGGSVGVFVNESLESNGDSESSDVGPLFSINLARAFERGAMSVGASQQITPSAGVAGVSTTQSAFGRFGTRLTERVNGQLGLSYTYFDASETNVQIATAGAGVSTTLWRHVSLAINYYFVYRDNDRTTNSLSAGSADGNVVSISLSGAYPLWQGDL